MSSLRSTTNRLFCVAQDIHTTLHDAARNGKMAVVKFLFKRGSDTSVKNMAGGDRHAQSCAHSDCVSATAGAAVQEKGHTIAMARTEWRYDGRALKAVPVHNCLCCGWRCQGRGKSEIQHEFVYVTQKILAQMCSVKCWNAHVTVVSAAMKFCISIVL